VSKVQEEFMDLWATLGVSHAAGVGLLVAAVAVAGVIVGVLVRRSRQPQRVQVELNGRG
jgi:uncharacterized membrane protein YhiD involved in acid resistance